MTQALADMLKMFENRKLTREEIRQFLVSSAYGNTHHGNPNITRAGIEKAAKENE